MICYQLICVHEHQFEAWFQNIASFDAQVAEGKITCPLCHSSEIKKAPMAPKIARQNQYQQLEKELKAVQSYVENHCDYVGDNFAVEAKKMHYGETETRNIYGKATLAEAKDLKEEGIETIALPFATKKPKQALN